jgi:hypothetical protein
MFGPNFLAWDSEVGPSDLQVWDFQFGTLEMFAKFSVSVQLPNGQLGGAGSPLVTTTLHFLWTNFIMSHDDHGKPDPKGINSLSGVLNQENFSYTIARPI